MAALSNEQIEDSMHATPSKDKLENYRNDTEVMMMIAKSKVKGFIAERFNRMYAERTQEKGQTQVEEALVAVFQLGKKATRDIIKTASAWFLQPIVTELFNRGELPTPSFRIALSDGHSRKRLWTLFYSREYAVHCSYVRWPASPSGMWTLY